MVHTGHIALMPPAGEKIPVGNENTKATEWVEAYLVESRAINGASGSPVFARPAITFGPIKLDSGMETKALWPESEIRLLGLFQGAWFLPPDDPLRKAVQSKDGDVVPVGLGVVVPSYKIIELLEEPALADERAKRPAVGARKATVSEVAPPATDENPNHREDFRRLLGAAARKPPQED
jgi:hypothetical protein